VAVQQDSSLLDFDNTSTPSMDNNAWLPCTQRSRLFVEDLLFGFKETALLHKSTRGLEICYSCEFLEHEREQKGAGILHREQE